MSGGQVLDVFTPQREVESVFFLTLTASQTVLEPFRQLSEVLGDIIDCVLLLPLS